LDPSSTHERGTVAGLVDEETCCENNGQLRRGFYGGFKRLESGCGVFLRELLAGGFNHFLFISLPGEMIPFD